MQSGQEHNASSRGIEAFLTIISFLMKEEEKKKQEMTV
jgi:hypothetical protein